MLVKILIRLKNGPKFIDAGTVFDGTKETLPDFVLYELGRRRGAVEILLEPIKKQEVRKVKVIKKEEQPPFAKVAKTTAPSRAVQKKAAPKITPAEAGAKLRKKLVHKEK